MAVISYLDAFPAPNALDILARHSQHEVLRVDSTAPLDEAFRVLERAHAYQCVGSRDEIPPELRVDAAFLEKATQMLVVSSSGAGTDVFDHEACTEAGVLIVNQSGANAEAVAETALAMMILLGKNLMRADRLLRRGWSGARRDLYGHDLTGRTVGIIGLGNIGRRVAEVCRTAFRCEVLAYDPYLSAGEITARNARPAAFEDLLAQSDYVTIHTPLTQETRHMMDARAFSRMREGAIVVCTARGGIHDEAALADALRAGHLAGAGLDVWEIEPPAPDHPLLGLDNVIASPHIAGGTASAVANMARYAAEQLITIFEGQTPPRPINTDVLPRFEARYHEMFGKAQG